MNIVKSSSVPEIELWVSLDIDWTVDFDKTLSRLELWITFRPPFWCLQLINHWTWYAIQYQYLWSNIHKYEQEYSVLEQFWVFININPENCLILDLHKHKPWKLFNFGPL